MPRKPHCCSCLYYFSANKLPADIAEKFYPDYDGWCDKFKEERDRDEPPCEYFQKMTNRGRE